MDLTLSLSLTLALIGMAAGLFGGFFGLGGGLLLIPALTLFQGSNPQLYQSVSFIVAALVAGTSLRIHLKAGAVVKTMAGRIGTISAAASVLGVMVSNSMAPGVFNGVFACFLVYVAGYELVTLTRTARTVGTVDDQPIAATMPKCAAVGLAIGCLSGLLGIGGGVIAVPLFRIVFGLPIRQAIGTSTATILPTLLVGGAAKLVSVGMGAVHSGDAASATAAISLRAILVMALPLSIGAIVGARIGTKLLLRISPRKAALAFALLLLFLAARMAGVL